jgi:hypothetical protein
MPTTKIVENGTEDEWNWCCNRCYFRVIGISGGIDARPETPPHALYCKKCGGDHGFHVEFVPQFRKKKSIQHPV